MTPPLTQRFDAEFKLAGVWLPASPAPDYFSGIDVPDTHQVETRQALKSDESSVVLNTNPTGAGKTLSWAAPTIRSGEHGDGWIVVATYPTNALVDDQLQKLRALASDYYRNPPPGVPDDIQFEPNHNGKPVIKTPNGTYSLEGRVRRVTGEDTLGTSTTAELNQVLDTALDASANRLPTIILTTPDLLTLVAKNKLHDPAVRGLVMGVDAIVVDEFHLANPRAKRHLPFYLDFYQNRLGNRTLLKNLVFLSATPDESYISQIQRGMNTKSVTRQTFSQQPAEQSRHILPEATLYTKYNPIFQNGDWLVERCDELMEWIESGQEQALIMLDSVREVNVLAAAIAEQTSLSVGKIFGWKKEGRQSVVESSDIIIGNTAMEVGIDFERVDRILTTGYTPTSAMQRIGRMRARDGLEGCEIALITTQEGHDAICQAATDGHLSRRELDRALHSIARAAETPYYGLLNAMYFQYLWSDASQPIGETIRTQDLNAYKQTVYDHFRDDGAVFDAAVESAESFWNELESLRTAIYSSGEEPVFEEMHSYRSSSLSVTIVDETDRTEPVKEYMLNYILRYGRGEFISSDEAEDVLENLLNRDVKTEDRKKLQARQKRSVATFRLQDFHETRFSLGIEDYRQIAIWRNACPTTGSEVFCPPQLMSDPTMKRQSGGIKGSEHIDIGNKVLAQYARGNRSTVRERFGLGPYANVYPVSDSEVIILWQDGILAHAALMNEQVG